MKLSRCILFIWLLLPFTGFAQLFPEAAKIKKAYDELLKNPLYAEAQMQFIIDFPPNKDTFLRVFNSPHLDQLYLERFAYLDTFKNFNKKYPELILIKCVGLGKQMIGNGDVAGVIQLLLIRLSNKHIATFVTQLKKLDKKEITCLAYFMANTTDASLVTKHQNMLEQLKEEKTSKAITNFIHATEERLAQPKE